MVEVDRIDQAFGEFLAFKDGSFSVKSFFRILFGIGLGAGFFGVILLALNFMHFIEVSRKVSGPFLIIAVLLLLFGRLGMWVNSTVQIRVYRNNDCPICRKPEKKMVLWDEVKAPENG